ncbi:MAG: septal ring lytic transglycosylase RlpA family protein [Alphaproteobacteria bacterium]
MNRNNLTSYISIIFFFSLLACSSKHETLQTKENITTYKGHYKVGNPYIVENVKYHPKKDHNYDETGMASWYGGEDGFHGKKTANGDYYDKKMLSAAHRTLPLPSIVKVTNLKNNKSVIVMVNDRGPFSKKRIIDVSEKAAEILHMKHQGSANVRVQFLKEETKKLLAALNLPEKEGAYAVNRSKIVPGSFLEASNKMHGIDLNKISNLKGENFSTRVLKDNKIISSAKNKSKIPLNTKNKYFVQVGTYKSRSNAEKIVRELSKFGKAKIQFSKSPIELYKVSFGPYNDSEAKPLLKHLSMIGNENVKLLASNVVK